MSSIGMGLLGGAVTFFNVRANSKPEPLIVAVPNVEPVYTRPTEIPADIKEELDQTPRWWDKQFHKLLESSGAEEVHVGEPEIIEVYSGTGDRYIYEERPVSYLRGCICKECHFVELLDFDIDF